VRILAANQHYRRNQAATGWFNSGEASTQHVKGAIFVFSLARWSFFANRIVDVWNSLPAIL